MRLRTGLVMVLFGGACAWLVASSREAPADPGHATPPPPVVLLEGVPDATGTRVVLRAPTSGAQAVVLGTVTHVAGSARRGTVDARGPGGASHPRVFVVAAERESRHGSTYESALWRVDGEGAAPLRLAGGLTDASRALLTSNGAVVVQRGRDGDEPVGPDHVLTERVDALTLDVVDPVSGATRSVWSGEGMIAWLAAPMRGDEVLVYHVHRGGAALFALDVVTRRTRPLIERMDALARDFSYDAVRDEVCFARVSPRHPGEYEVVTLAAHGPPVAPDRVSMRWRSPSDHMMPRALAGGVVVFSLPGDRGLGMLEAWPRMPERVAPLGDGADEVVGVSADARWVAIRHRGASREVLGLYDVQGKRTVAVDRPEVYVEFAGFAPGAVVP